MGRRPQIRRGAPAYFCGPANYREWMFVSSGPAWPTALWPDGAMMVLEVRASDSKASINQGSHFEAGVVSMELHVKDEKRFPQVGVFRIP